MKQSERYIRLVGWLGLVGLLVATGVLYATTPPVAVDDVYTTLPDEALSVDAPGVLSNDDDGDGDTLTAILVDSSQANGLLLLEADGAFEYEPAPGFIGVDVFTYIAHDGVSGSNEANITFIVTGTVAITTYTNQFAFLNALSALGHTIFLEGFEDDMVWGDVRTTISGGQHTAPEHFNQGITWTANNLDSEITTGDGPPWRGQWGFFTLPHGSYATGDNCDQPVNCGDGWRGLGDGRLVAIGGWVETNTPYAGINMFLDGDMNAPIDFNVTLGTQYQFVGIITPQGFEQFEFRETEGVSEEQKFIFGDHFFFAFATDLFMRSSHIQLSAIPGGAYVRGRVVVEDDAGTPVSGALVTAEWRYPDGSVTPVTGMTNILGRVQWFAPTAGPGTYSLTILAMDKPEYVFLGGAMSQSLVVTLAGRTEAAAR